MKLLSVVLVAIMLLLCFITVVSCAVASPLEDFTWVLTSYGQPGKMKNALPDVTVTAYFDSKDKTLKGSGGCNTYGGKYDLENLTLSFPEHLTMTKMACSGEVDLQENEYINILNGADSFNMDHGNLVIHSGNSELIFRQEKLAQPTITQWGQ